jgi:hypothetical protein
MIGIRAGMLSVSVACVCVGAALGAAPAARSYVGVEQAIAKARAELAKPGPAGAEPSAPGWNAYFDAVQRDLTAYASAPNDTARLTALGRLYQIWSGLRSVNWASAAEVRESLATWLRPRVMLAWADRQLHQAVAGLQPAPSAQEKQARDRWIQFADSDIGAAFRDYESAVSVAAKNAALTKLRAALGFVELSQRSTPWGPTQSLQSALNDLFNQPNLHATADAASLQPRLAHVVVESGPVYRRGNISQVTAGEYRGFGLLPSDDGVAFYNKQLFSSITPVNNFNGEMAADPRGRRVTKLYYFSATTTDAGEVTAVAVLRPTGLFLYSDATHNTNAAICAAPTADHDLGRAVAGVIGMNQQRIVEKVYEGAIGKIRASVLEEARAEANERLAKAQVEQNALLKANLPGDGTLVVRNVVISDLSLRSRPDRAMIDGKVQWRGRSGQAGAESPVPNALFSPTSGVAADVHLSSVLTNLAGGYLDRDDVRAVQNVMIVTRKTAADAPPSEGIEVKPNTDWESFSKAVDTARAANDPKVLAIRVKRPTRPPAFSVDKDGNLVALVRDFVLEAPVPDQAPKVGPPARIYRFDAPEAEFSISFKVLPASGSTPIKFAARIEGFDPGPGARIFAINDDESKAAELNRFTGALIFGAFGTKLRGQPIDVPLTQLDLRGYELSSVSPLDPSGWMRVVLKPKP